VISAGSLLSRPTYADPVDHLLRWIETHFRIKAKPLVTLGAFRGGGERAGGLWIVPSKGGEPRSLSAALDLRAPLYLSDGTIVALAASSRLVHLAARNGQMIGPGCSTGSDPIDVIFAAGDATRIGAVTRTGQLIEIQLANCRRERLRSLPSESKHANQIRIGLQARSRECDGLQVAIGIRDEDVGRGTQREDILVRAGDGTVNRLTQSDPRRFHSAPAFSPDCTEIVYVRADSPQ
jgi:hypothetical protein